MSSSGESAVIGKLLSGTEVAKYVLISFIYFCKLIKNQKKLCLHFASITVIYWSSVQQ
jgi:hypothetical protein